MAEKKPEPKKTPKKAPAKKAEPAKKKAAPKKTTEKKPAQKRTTRATESPLEGMKIPTKRQSLREAPIPVERRWPYNTSIAERMVVADNHRRSGLWTWIAIVLLAIMAGVFKYAMVGYSFSALVCVCLAGVLLFYRITNMLRRNRGVRILQGIVTFIIIAGIIVVGTTEALIINASFGNPKASFDYLVVLGAGVHGSTPSLSLRNRIDTAYDYLTGHPDVVAVLTGGMGEGESITEADCMFDALTARGIDPERLILEENATSTWENLHYSMDLLEQRTGSRPEKIGVLSSEYHLFRASLFAKECGVGFVGIPAKTTKISLRINYFMREAAGVWHYLLLGGQYHD